MDKFYLKIQSKFDSADQHIIFGLLDILEQEGLTPQEAVNILTKDIKNIPEYENF